jgi:glycosyltransferase involved in cell wall biosynthesis
MRLQPSAWLVLTDHTTKMLPFVSIVICTKNRCDALQKYALPSLEQLDYPSFEVVVVDDASSDGTQQFLRQYSHSKLRLNVVRNAESRGLCNARNVGIGHSRGEIIAFIDDDCAVTHSWLSEIVRAYDREEVAVVGGISFRGDSEEIYINDRHVWGCNMSFRASIFRQFRFDTGLKYSHYADETDLIGRIIDHGFVRVVAKKAIARHYVEAAAYRKQVPLSGYLNYHYLNAKKGSLWGYYGYVFSHSLKHVALVEYGLNFKGQAMTWLQIVPAVIRKSFYYGYVLLLEIPVAAKRKHAQEEALFRRPRSFPV